MIDEPKRERMMAAFLRAVNYHTLEECDCCHDIFPLWEVEWTAEQWLCDRYRTTTPRTGPARTPMTSL